MEQTDNIQNVLSETTDTNAKSIRYEAEKRIYKYERYTDIVSFIRDKDDAVEFLKYVANEGIKFLFEMKKKNTPLVYPLRSNLDSRQVEVDYDFFMHCLAKFVSIKTNNEDDYTRIVLTYLIHKASPSEHARRVWLFATFHLYGMFYVSKKQLYTRNYNYVFMPKVYSVNSTFITFNAISLNLNMLESALGEGFKDFIATLEITSVGINEETYGPTNVKKFWDTQKTLNNEEKKHLVKRDINERIKLLTPADIIAVNNK